MAHKQFALDESLMVTVYKRKINKNIRLSIASDGKVRVSIPMWAPYKVGVVFAKQRRGWIDKQRKESKLLTDGQVIGRTKYLRFERSNSTNKPSSLVRQQEIVVRVPANMSTEDTKVQEIATKASIRALRAEAEADLPPRLNSLASDYGFSYKSITIKKLKSRWGSCDQHGNIVLNLYLVQLPFDLVEYVILHELMHTKHLHHGADFWSDLIKILPDVRQRRKLLRDHQPILGG